MPPTDNTDEVGAIPRHVAIVMDGNGRWARERELPRERGHEFGRSRLHEVIRAFSERGVQYLTLFAFSTENWRRPSDEVQGLMALAAEAIREDAPRLHDEGARLIHLGRKDRIDPRIAAAIDRVVDMTRNNTGITLCVAFDYGGREEILEAAKSLLRDAVSPDDVDESLFVSRLFSHDLPDPDLLIRTGGELRISNFLLWQAAYAELYFTPTLWPDFGPDDVTKALDSYTARKRRFGGVEAD